MSEVNSRRLLRAARRILAQLERRPPQATLDELPHDAWQKCQRAHDYLETAERHSWRAAARDCRDRLRWALDDLRRQLDAAGEQLEHSGPARRASLGEVYADLAALDEEFAEVSIDLQENAIAVTTSPVVLEGVDLGRFKITLDWERLGQGSSYAVEALDPFPSAGDESVTHPHVRDDGLCEGEASSALRAALAGGRLFDFFAVVAQTLATYNPHSAYVALERWHGSSCSDCGATVDDDDLSSCERCSADVCGDCSAGCEGCSRLLCSACSLCCFACHATHCASCLAPCITCHQDFCEGCLDEEPCPECRQRAAVPPAEEEAPDREAAAGPPAAPADAAADALCLGAAPVSA